MREVRWKGRLLFAIVGAIILAGATTGSAESVAWPWAYSIFALAGNLAPLLALGCGFGIGWALPRVGGFALQLIGVLTGAALALAIATAAGWLIWKILESIFATHSGANTP